MHQRCDADAVDPDKRLVKNKVHNGVGAIQWNYDRAEIIADGVVHCLGISLGLGAAFTLLIMTDYTTSIHPWTIPVLNGVSVKVEAGQFVDNC